LRLITLLLIWICYCPVNSQTPTWSESIAKIIYKNCTSCHRSGGSGPFSMMSYGQAFNNRNSIKFAVSQKNMPPWPPDVSYSKLAHVRALAQEDIDAIVKWVDGGGPSGNLSKAPPAPEYDNLGFIKNPQLVMNTPNYTLPTNVDEYRCFPDSSRLTKDMWLTGLECIPGNPEIVHHILIFRDGGTKSFQLDSREAGPGYLCFGGAGTSDAALIGAWVPGSQPFVLPKGFGIKIPARSNIIIQVHYPGGAKGKSDQTLIKLQLTDQPLRETYLIPILNHEISMTNGPLKIPANTIKTFNQRFFVPLNFSVIGVAPHMHLIGTSIKTWAVGPDQKEIPLINIPHWDFHWQGIYQFEKIIKIPAGSMLLSEATYDNTSANHHNPNFPPKEVKVGEATTDEMMLTYFLFTLYQPGDETIIIDSSKALTSPVAEAIPSTRPVLIVPNPVSNANSKLLFKTTLKENVSMNIYDLVGRLIQHIPLEDLNPGSHDIELNTAGLVSGTYIVRLKGSDWQSIKKWMVIRE